MGVPGSPIGALDENLLGVIFGFLETDDRNAASLVCRKWLQVDGRSRTTLRATNPGRLSSLARRFPQLTSLDLSDGLPLTNDDLAAVADLWGGTLRHLNVNGHKGITDAGFMRLCCSTALRSLQLAGCFSLGNCGAIFIAHNCLQLEVLDLRGCAEIGDPALVAFGELLPSLQSLVLDGCKEVTATGLKALAQGCPKLKEISLKSCDQADDEAIIALAKRCPSLEKVALGGVSISNTSLEALGSFCSALQVLVLWYTVEVTDAGLRAIAACCQELTGLGLYGCSQVSSDGLSAIASQCRKLKLLELRTCPYAPEAGLEVLTQQSPALETLVLANCNDMRPQAFAMVAGLTNLKCLRLDTSRSVVDASLTAIGASCRQLAVLSLYACIHVGTPGVVAVAEGCRDSLTELDLSMCVQVTDGALKALSRCHGLRVLRLSYNKKVTAGGLAHLAEGCAELRELALNECDGATDQSLAALVGGCSQLQELDLSKCPGISGGGLSSLCQLPRLRTLLLARCGGATPEGLHWMAREPHRLKAVTLESSMRTRLAPEFVAVLDDRGCRINWQ